nr:MAG TPA: hypothetical protein [Caudoviricetes sp.]DAY83927.1 MAG TPA: hypothetical protein [Caudoviricetes sp.]
MSECDFCLIFYSKFHIPFLFLQILYRGRE